MSRKNSRRKKAVNLDVALALRAFGLGFAAGADPRTALRRHAVEAATHEHWRRGFEAGRDAVATAEHRYGTVVGDGRRR